MSALQWFTRTTLNQIKQGIDSFNREHKTCAAGYPDIVEIEHEGVKFIVPFCGAPEKPSNKSETNAEA